MRKIQSARLFFYCLKYRRNLFIKGNIRLRRGFEIRIKAESGQIVIGENCLLGKQCTLLTQGPGRINIGKNTSIRKKSTIGAVERVTIGANVIISRNVIIVDNNNHPTHPADRLKLVNSGFGSKLWGWEYSSSSPIVINDNVWIGENVRILKGVEIGENSIIGASSVVTKDVPANSIVGGNPARLLKQEINLINNRVF